MNISLAFQSRGILGHGFLFLEKCVYLELKLHCFFDVQIWTIYISVNRRYIDGSVSQKLMIKLPRIFLWEIISLTLV